jgi:hypothetical protein
MTMEHFDYSKLVSFTEFVPRVEPTDAIAIIETFRQHHRQRFGDVDPARYDEQYAFADFKSEMVARMFADEPDHLWGALGSIVNTPRELKRVLRTVRDAWIRLHGEVNFDELLITNVLRESGTMVLLPGVGEARVFDLITRNVSWLRSRLRPGRDDRTPTSIEERALSQFLEARANPTATLLRFLFGKTDQRNFPQAVALDGRTDYWSRINAGEHDDDVRDQVVISALQSWIRSRGVSADAVDDRIITWMMKDDMYAAKLIQFAAGMKIGDREAVLKAVLRRTLSEWRTVARDERSHEEALVNLARLFRDSPLPAGRRLPQVTAAIAEAMPISLVLAYHIEYWLVNRPTRGIWHEPDSPEARAEVAESVRAAFHRSFDGPGGASRLVSAIPSDAPFALSWIINRKWDNNGDAPPPDYKAWSRSAEVLVAAAELSPATAGRALATVVGESVRVQGDLETDQDTGDLQVSHSWEASLNVELARELFGPLMDRAMRALARVPISDLDGQSGAHIGAAVEFAQKWIPEHELGN